MPSFSTRLDQVAKFANDECALEIIRSGTLSSKARGHLLHLILKTPRLPRYLYENRVMKPYNDKGFSVIGSGFHAIAVAHGDTSVKKFYPATSTLSDEDKNAYIDRHERKQALTARHLGSFALLQDYAVEPSPLSPDTTIVTATQARITGTSIPLRFRSAPPDHPEINDFLARSRDMHKTSSALPDIVGSRNLFAVGKRLILVDPIALERSDPSDTEAFTTASDIVHSLTPGSSDQLD